jgi:hypothetical protein
MKNQNNHNQEVMAKNRPAKVKRIFTAKAMSADEETDPDYQDNEELSFINIPVSTDDEKSKGAVDFEDPHNILNQIKRLKESQIGEYEDFVGDFDALIRNIKQARAENVPYNSVNASRRIGRLIASSDLHDIFSCFGGIYEFIIHLHNVHEVKLNAGTPEIEDEQLRDLLEDTIRKYTIES